MSFLYKALLKNDHQADSASATPASGFEPAGQASGTLPPYSATMAAGNAGYGQAMLFAPEKKAQIPTLMWVCMGLALLIIGLLGGYILADKQSLQPAVMSTGTQKPSPHELENKTHETGVEQVAQVESSSAAQASAPVVDAESAMARGDSPAAVESEPFVEVAVSNEGQVITQVSRSREPEQLQQVNEPQSGTIEATVTPLSAKPADTVELADIPEALKQQFAQAVEVTEEVVDADEFEPAVSSQSSLTFIQELSEAEKAGLPEIEYQMHIYASDMTERWVKLNGRVFTQGEEFMPGLKLLEIRQDMLVWETRFSRFAQEALVDFRHQ